MKARHFFVSTLKQAPSDAEIISHQLMMRAGYIKRLGSGIYTYMPIALRSIRKIEQVVRQELNQSGAMELLMPAVQPAELWQESGRWEQYGAELLRLKDRHQREFVIGPTHEEVITDIARKEIRSYKQLPITWYQIQTKFRDEIRPRFGVMRGREFIMKDAYSFDKDTEGLKKTYQIIFDAYTRIFTRLNLDFRAVAADNGSIGGSGSHEFHVIAKTGEDDIVFNPNTDYAANIEAAEAVCLVKNRNTPAQELTKTETPGQSKCADVAALLNIPLEQTVKSIVLAVDQKNEDDTTRNTQIVLALLRGDHELNEIKLGKLEGMTNFRMATEAEIAQFFNAPAGYLGPIRLNPDVQIIADLTVANMSDWVCGANEKDMHFTGVNWGRDLPEPHLVHDIRNVVAGDPSPDGQGTVDICRGIEVGHVFQLGNKYSKSMNATFLDDNGKPQFMEMGCYGIGITRILGAAIEQNHDERGMMLPTSIAPFELVICPVGADKNPEVEALSQKLYQTFLAQGIDVILDDRGERPGVMFADWELIGVPYKVVVGDRGLKEGIIEFQVRRDGEAQKIAIDELNDVVKNHILASRT